MITARSFASLALLGLLTTARSGGTEPIRLHGQSSAARAITGHQSKELGFGGAVRAGAEVPFVPQVGAIVELGGVYLLDGDPPDDPNFKDQEAAAALGASLGIHLRPFTSNDPTALNLASGLWTQASFGAMGTGGEIRLHSEVNLGLDFLVEDGWFALGPAVGWLHVFQPNGELRPADGNILLFGIHGVFDTAEKVAQDTDADGIVDTADRCPNDPEDKDGFQDDDGCPEADNDQDGVIDGADNCPTKKEDRDNFQDDDGCPDPDNDRDEIPDAKDECPLDAEDRDDFEDEDGCPEKDNDQDGIPDNDDLCPNEPETFNKYADHDGCPDSEQIRVVGDKIVLDERVHFRLNSSVIRIVSFPLLERLAQLIKDNPDYVHIAIEGHTDSRGSADFNMQLSQSRAEAVRTFLIDQGVAEDRLSAKGFGLTQPLVKETGEYAEFMNRRVEFKITRKKKVPASQVPDDASPVSEAEPSTEAGGDSAGGAASEASGESAAPEPAKESQP